MAKKEVKKRSITSRKGKFAKDKAGVTKIRAKARMSYGKKIEEIIINLWKEYKSASKIGEVLRDQYAIGDVREVLGKKLGEFLYEKKLLTYPEDLKNLVEKAKRIKKHIEVHKQDKHSKHRLEVISGRIKRLGDYYFEKGKISERPKI